MNKNAMAYVLFFVLMGALNLSAKAQGVMSVDVSGRLVRTHASSSGHFGAASSSELPQPLRVGVFAADAPAVLSDLGARMSRVMVNDDVIAEARQEAIETGNDPPFIERLKAIVEIDVVPVVSLRWPVDPAVKGDDPDRVPEGIDYTNSLDLVEWLLLQTAGKLNHVAINNEPLLGVGRYPPEQMEAGFAWMTAVAERINALRTTHSELADLKIIIPVELPTAYIEGNASAGMVKAVEGLIQIGIDHADLLDLHIYASHIAEMEEKLALLTSLADVPIVVLEWSQAPVADAWRQEMADPSLGVEMTNEDFMLAAYENPVTEQEWADFVAMAPFDPHFMWQAVEVMSAFGVQMAAYGGAYQYGNPRFDLPALFANMAVAENTPNEPFFSAFRALNGDLIDD